MNAESRIIAVNLMSWARGLDAPQASPDVVVSAEAGLVDILAKRDFFTPGTVVFSPKSDGGIKSDILKVIDYVGDFNDPDADIQVGDDFYVQQQSYAVSEFVPVGGPTILRVDSEDDRASFYRDADVARIHGRFPLGLMHPQSVLGDMPKLGFVPATTEVSHFFLNIDGAISTSPSGIALGDVTDPESVRSEYWAVGIREISQQLPVESRSWISQYMLALEALRLATARGLRDMRVSGFGSHFVSALDAEESFIEASPSLLLLFNEQVVHLHDSRSSRTYKLGSDAARIIDVMMHIGDRSPARAAHLLGCSESVALTSMQQIQGLFAAKGVQFTASESVGI